MFLEQQISILEYMWWNIYKTENSTLGTGINYILQYIKIESISNNIPQYFFFIYIYIYTVFLKNKYKKNAALGRRDFKNTSLTPNFEYDIVLNDI